MHKTYFASGFLYHSPSQKILLQHTSNDKNFSFTLFSTICLDATNPAKVFQKLIANVLGITIPLSSIKHVYDYVPENEDNNQHVFYADIDHIAEELDFTKKLNAEWFTTKQLSKLKLNKQTDHNIMIGQRVIRASILQPQ